MQWHSSRLACVVIAAAASSVYADLPKPPTFETPKGWKAVDAGATASFRYEIAEGDQLALMSITGLPGEAGGLAANVNRWRAQVGLEALEEKEAAKSPQSIKVDGVAGHYLFLKGKSVDGKPEQNALVAVVSHAGRTWFFKLSGAASLVADQKSAFDEFLKSVRFANEP